jgi:hypothetical protein
VMRRGEGGREREGLGSVETMHAYLVVFSVVGGGCCSCLRLLAMMMVALLSRLAGVPVPSP